MRCLHQELVETGYNPYSNRIRVQVELHDRSILNRINQCFNRLRNILDAPSRKHITEVTRPEIFVRMFSNNFCQVLASFRTIRVTRALNGRESMLLDTVHFFFDEFSELCSCFDHAWVVSFRNLEQTHIWIGPL